MCEQDSKKLLIVYHSQSGRNRHLAYAARASALAAEPEINVRLLRAAEAGTADILWCDGLLLVFPEYSAGIAGGMKEFLDRVFYPSIRLELCRPYALFICTGNDGRNARDQTQRIAKGIPFTPVNEPKIFRGAPDDTAIAQIEEVAGAMAAGLCLGIF